MEKRKHANSAEVDDHILSDNVREAITFPHYLLKMNEPVSHGYSFADANKTKKVPRKNTDFYVSKSMLGLLFDDMQKYWREIEGPSLSSIVGEIISSNSIQLNNLVYLPDAQRFIPFAHYIYSSFVSDLRLLSTKPKASYSDLMLSILSKYRGSIRSVFSTLYDRDPASRSSHLNYCHSIASALYEVCYSEANIHLSRLFGLPVSGPEKANRLPTTKVSISKQAAVELDESILDNSDEDSDSAEEIEENDEFQDALNTSSDRNKSISSIEAALNDKALSSLCKFLKKMCSFPWILAFEEIDELIWFNSQKSNAKLQPYDQGKVYVDNLLGFDPTSRPAFPTSLDEKKMLQILDGILKPSRVSTFRTLS